jgi:dTDP-glucose 4,6-dehydratase
VGDRPGHDRRYAIDAAKITTELGWKPRHSFEIGLEATISWSLNNLGWFETMKKRSGYEGQRIGTIAVNTSLKPGIPVDYLASSVVRPL